MSIETIFTNARTHSFWQDKKVAPFLLQELTTLALLGPTSANMLPMRLVFVQSPEAKAKLKPLLDAGNVEKTMSAPVTAIVGMDIAFYEKLPKTFPQADAKSWFDKLPEPVLETIALRNSSLQGAYLIIAARALGLDCGPMSGFNNVKVDEVFFAGTRVKSNFLINLGYGDAGKLHPRNPRLPFNEIATIV